MVEVLQDCGLAEKGFRLGEEVRHRLHLVRRTERQLFRSDRHLEVDDLIVSEAHVGKAIVIKRFVPRGRGRVGRVFKPFANLTIVVRQVEAAAS